MDGAFYFGGGPQTRKVRNLAENPSVAVHPVGEDALVLEGIAEVVTDPDPALAERVSAGPRPGCAHGELENPVPLGLIRGKGKEQSTGPLGAHCVRARLHPDYSSARAW